MSLLIGTGRANANCLAPRELAAIFGDFALAQVDCPADSEVNFVGAIHRHEFLCEPRGTPPRKVRPGLPGIDHELFEWITLCDAIRDAPGAFTFMEVGAGFGRWTANAVCAARRRGIRNVEVTMVEVEPTHCRWARLNMADNGILPEQFELIEAATAGHEGERVLLIACPLGPNPRDFYGQMLMPGTIALRPTGKTYAGCPAFEFNDGLEGIKVRTKSLASIIGDRACIDLIDMDIQGAEGEVIENSADVLTERVRRLYIETHTPEVERVIRDTLTPAGWVNVFDFPLGPDRETPYGAVDFSGGGAQSWVNPRIR